MTSSLPDVGFMDLLSFWDAAKAAARVGETGPFESNDHLDKVFAKFSAKSEEERFLFGMLVDTDMVDYDYAAGKISPQSRLYTHFSQVKTGKPLADRIRRVALDLPILESHPPIRDEFEASLKLRTLYWAPVLDHLTTELKIEPSDAFIRLLATWFTLVHISGPADHWIDQDPVSTHWNKLGFLGTFELLLSMKDQSLRLALDANRDEAGTLGQNPARAVLSLASSAITVTLGNTIDASGGLDVDLSKPNEFAAKVALYEKLVRWKSAEIYRVLFHAIAVYAGCQPNKVEALADFGEHVGVCIQLLDDVGGIWETGQDLTKPVCKMLFPLGFVLNADTEQREVIIRELSRSSLARDRDYLQSLFIEAGARDFLSLFVEERRQRCVERLEDAELRTAFLLQWFDDYFSGFRL